LKWATLCGDKWRRYQSARSLNPTIDSSTNNVKQPLPSKTVAVPLSKLPCGEKHFQGPSRRPKRRPDRQFCCAIRCAIRRRFAPGRSWQRGGRSPRRSLILISNLCNNGRRSGLGIAREYKERSGEAGRAGRKPRRQILEARPDQNKGAACRVRAERCLPWARNCQCCFLLTTRAASTE
jgi:hypothetical protein